MRMARSGRTTSRVLPMSNGRGEVQRRCTPGTQAARLSSDEIDSQTRSGETSSSIGKRWTIGAVRKNDSSAGLSGCHVTSSACRIGCVGHVGGKDKGIKDEDNCALLVA